MWHCSSQSAQLLLKPHAQCTHWERQDTLYTARHKTDRQTDSPAGVGCGRQWFSAVPSSGAVRELLSPAFACPPEYRNLNISSNTATYWTLLGNQLDMFLATNQPRISQMTTETKDSFNVFTENYDKLQKEISSTYISITLHILNKSTLCLMFKNFFFFGILWYFFVNTV